MDQRLMLVHAHPDDETIGQGATMASYVARGTQVTLVTCTLGEEGEVLVPGLEHLAADRDDALGEHRITELANAMKELGVTDYRFLGGAKRYRDSGMMWDEQRRATARPETKEGTFWRADLLEPTALLVEIIREVRPQVLVTYDQYGSYGHPDHIQAHRVATYATSLAAVPSYRPELGAPWDIAKVYWGAMSVNMLRESLRALRAAGDTTSFEGMDPEGELPAFMVPDDQLSAVVDANDYADTKIRAMKAHATQIAVDGPFFALSDNTGNHVWGTEFYRLAKGVKGPTNEDGLETDLFAGLD
jgi:N-acetyl-1-D-myo-inositol-2-amino-2-deoxy-alpha-D-glucopyranoside deacetylase